MRQSAAVDEARTVGKQRNVLRKPGKQRAVGNCTKSRPTNLERRHTPWRALSNVLVNTSSDLSDRNICTTENRLCALAWKSIFGQMMGLPMACCDFYTNPRGKPIRTIWMHADNGWEGGVNKHHGVPGADDIHD